ncbi:MAG: hypothetical protein HYX28_05860 [Candidatus Koribacter versatilis]|uniref:NHL repeat protein n=1 Tax=Candidatus Korobacter versatilis TaxID=658062 RepID=A0A932A832_9BACT|nr:hypothetical protein [Candidatus Koribacter versatilis]
MKTKRSYALLAIGCLFSIAAVLLGCSSGELASILGGGSSPVIFTNGQSANIVIGQVDFVSSASPNPPTASSLNGSYSSPWVTSAGVLILPDENNDRTLVFNSIPTSNGASATYAIGQLDLVSNGGGTSATKTSCPEQVIVVGGKMIQADYCNNRVIIYNSVPSGSPGTIDVVVGQVDKVSSASTCDAGTLDSVESVAVANGKLIVTDGDHNRILIWNSIPTSDGVPANLVLGQADFTSCAENRGGAVGANTLGYPNGMWTDGTRLVVEDDDNNRVLIWNSIPTTNGQPADLVLGQPDFTSNGDNQGGPASAATMSFPYDGVFFTQSQLFITDNGNNRVLIWNTFPTTNDKPADVVLGQPDMATISSSTTASTMDGPAGILLVGKQLIVSDPGNHRYLIFNGR